MLFKTILIISLICSSAFANNLVGTWKLTNKERAFKFSSAVGYEMQFRFNADGTLDFLQNSANVMGSTRHYELKGNQLTVMLKNKNMGTAQNFGLGIISSQTLTITPTKNNCYLVYEKQPNQNTFEMCKQ